MAKHKFLDVSDVTSTQMQGRPGEQASDVYLLRTNGTGALGTQGQKRGFAKYKYDTTNPEEAQRLAPVTVTSSILYDFDRDMGASKKGLDGDRGLLARSVASSRVDSLLGTQMLCQETFGIDANGRPMGVSMEADGVQVRSNWSPDEGSPKKSCLLDVDYKDPQIQRGLSDLQVLDYVTGQLDRHAGNIMIDPVTKKVTGIDNDLAFPEMDREGAIDQDLAVARKAVAGVPKQIHTETASKVLALSPDQLARELRKMPVPKGCNRLSEQEIEGAKQRLVTLQNAIRNPAPNGVQIVSEFNNDTYDQAVNQQAQKFEETRHWSKKVGKITLGDRQVDPEARTFGNQLTEDEREHVGLFSKDLGNVPLTSYLGGVVIEQKRNELGRISNPGDNGLRPSDTGHKAERSLEAVNDRAVKLEQEREALQRKLAGYEKRLEKLKDPSIGLQIKSLRYGGVDRAQTAFAKKEADVSARLNEISHEMKSLQRVRLELGDPIALAQEQVAQLRQQNAQTLHRCNNPANNDPQLRPDQLEAIVNRDAPRLLAEGRDKDYGSVEDRTVDYKAIAKDSFLNTQDRKPNEEELRSTERALIGKFGIDANNQELDAIMTELSQMNPNQVDPQKMEDLLERVDDVKLSLRELDAKLKALDSPTLSTRERLKQANNELAQEKLLQQQSQEGPKVGDSVPRQEQDQPSKSNRKRVTFSD